MCTYIHIYIHTKPVGGQRQGALQALPLTALMLLGRDSLMCFLSAVTTVPRESQAEHGLVLGLEL